MQRKLKNFWKSEVTSQNTILVLSFPKLYGIKIEKTSM